MCYGNFGFSSSHRIESIGIIETSKIYKIYWVDEINQPRLINIMDYPTNPHVTDNTYFDFSPNVSVDSLDVQVTKYNSGGIFPAGTV